MPHQQSSTRNRLRFDFNEPKQYKVLIYNDDFTTMDFVVKVLQLVFRKTLQEAESLMLSVHESDHAVAGVYSYDIALSKRNKAMSMARNEGFPLRLECVPAE